ncbi:MAG: ral nucleoside transport system ATP-binding protein, partial [Actinomycetota bacterium]|nr:ral nucleoside transport system ATP-binding protein [Actinomycetota bacterium]
MSGGTDVVSQPVPGAPPAPAIELRSVTKRFGSVAACNRVDLSAFRGEIHGVLGQNGAGKTTLMNMLLGLVTPDAGEILIDGRPAAIHDPIEAARLGIAMVHQHFSLIGPLTVWENVTLGEQGRIEPDATMRRVTETAERYGLAVDPRARVKDLTTGERQRVEIVKCLMRRPDVFILDEPTSVLTTLESFELFGVLRTVVQEENRAVILISHKLDEILYATDRVTVMRNGAVAARMETAATDADELAREMIGRVVSLHSIAPAVGHLETERRAEAPNAAAASGRVASATMSTDTALAIRDVTVIGPDGRTLLDRFSLDLRRGEIVGLAGTEGNGQKALGDLLSSLVAVTSGSVEVGGLRVDCGRAGAMAHAGVGVVPEDRRSASILELSVAENLVVGDLDRVSTGRFVNRKRLRALAHELVQEFAITTASVDTPMASLSGGNQQRVVLARELSRSPAVLVAAQPTSGLDVEAIEYMTDRIRAAAARGVAVLLVSTELEELLALAHRIAVIYRGRIVGEMARDQ